MQKDVCPLAEKLCDLGYQVLIETNGTIDIGKLDKRVIKIMDIKTPESGSAANIDFENLKKLSREDEVKFVICSREDYLFARDIIEKYSLADRVTVLISAAFERLEPKEAVKWILEDGLKVRFQLQIHKYIWEPGKRRV